MSVITKKIGTVEYIVTQQIAILKEHSDTPRELTLEEVKRLDILARIQKNIDKKEEDVDETAGMSEDELRELADGS